MPHVPDSHADHDPLAIAAFAAGDAAGPELDDALALVAACPECAALHHDLRAIATAVTALPAPVRTRDFRLAPEQAAALRPSGWRRFLAPLAGPRFAFAGPLGTGLATLGIAGLLVAGSLGAPVASVAPAADGGAAMATDEATTMIQAVPEGVIPAPEGAAQASMAPAENPVPAASGEAPAHIDNAGTDTSAGEASPAPAGYGAAGGDVKASPDGVRAAAGPAEQVERTSTAEAPVGTPAAQTAVLLGSLAGMLLVAGILLASARLVARRVA